MIAKYTKRFYT